MKILDRLSSGLVNPKRLKLFYKDKGGLVVLFFAILIVILMLPNIFSICKTDYLDYETELEVRNLLAGLDIPYEIKDYKLTYNGLGSENEYVYVVGNDFDICFTTQESVNTNNIYNSNTNKQTTSLLFTRNIERICFILYEDNISIQAYGFDYKLGTYSEYESFEGIDFSNSNINNFDLWDPFYAGCKKMLNKYIPYIKVASIFVALFNEIVSLLLWTLFTCIISRLTNKDYAFKDQWKIVIYCSTPYVLGCCVSSLLNYGFLYYIGLILSIFYAFGFDKFGGQNNEL